MKHEEIVSILCELHKISGLRVSLHGTDFCEIAAYPEHRLPFCAAIQKFESEYERCVKCDTEACRRVKSEQATLIYKCRHGLTEVICPLYNFGTLTGYLMMGQIADESVERDSLEMSLRTLGYSVEEARLCASGVSRIDSELLGSYVKIMTICAEYMTLTNALPSRAPKVPELAKIYIHEHYADKVTIRDICKSLGCSKSSLLSSFKAEYDTTVNAYLCEVRLREAKRLLQGGNMSISAIAEATGFYDQSYFSKVFLQREGLTPTEYRKELNA